MYYKMSLTQENAFAVIVDGQIKRFQNRGMADAFAQSEIADAGKGHYEISVIVVRCLMHNESE